MLSDLQNLAVPVGWQLSSVGKVADIRNNLREPISVDERAKIEGPYPYYGPTGILSYINEFRIEGQYVLISEDGDHFLKYKEVPMTLFVSGQFNVNNHAHLLRGTPSCKSEWLFYFFNHTNLGPFITRQGVGRYKLTKEALTRLPILLPSIHEQEEICTIFSTWDRAIEKTERLIAAKRRRKQALMQQLLTGTRRFPRCNGKWRKMRLRDVFESVYRSVTPNVGAVLSISSRKGFERQEDKFSKVIAGKNLDNYVLLRNGEFAYNKGNSKTYPQGCVFRLDDYEEAAVPNVYFCFAFRDATQADSDFYRQYFEAGLLNEGLRGLINTGVRNNGLLNIYEDDFYELRVLLPPIAEQRKIAGLLCCCDRETDALCCKLDALKEQKKGLMQKLLTGKVRVGE